MQDGEGNITPKELAACQRAAVVVLDRSYHTTLAKEIEEAELEAQKRTPAPDYRDSQDDLHQIQCDCGRWYTTFSGQMGCSGQRHPPPVVVYVYNNH